MSMLFTLAIMEDGSGFDALALLFFALFVPVTIVLLILLIFEKTRKFAGRGMVFMVATLAVLSILSGLGGGKKKAKISGCFAQLHQIGRECVIYAVEHDGAFPASLADLAKQGVSPGGLVCPDGKTKPGPMETADLWADYVLVTNVTQESDPDAILIYCKPGNHGQGEFSGVHVLYVDGDIEWVEAE